MFFISSPGVHCLIVWQSTKLATFFVCATRLPFVSSFFHFDIFFSYLAMAPPMATDVQSTMDTHINTFSDGLSVNGVAARRCKAPRMSGGIAAHASSDMFKGPVRTSNKPKFKGDVLCADRYEENQKLRGGIVRSSPTILRGSQTQC